jgi:hypothetical protein
MPPLEALINGRAGGIMAILRVAASVVLFGVALSASATAGTVCTNGRCVTCSGALSCVDGQCLCNGAPVLPGAVTQEQAPCGAEKVVPHPNGGGQVGVTASVDPSAYLSPESAVCGHAKVTGPARISGGSLVNGAARIVGRTNIERSVVNGQSLVSGSRIVGSTINGGSEVLESEITDSSMNGGARAEGSTIASSVVNGGATVKDRTLAGVVIAR